MNNSGLHKYDDIIHLPHHVSKKHPPMSRIERAAQFGAFAALTGHSDAISETGRLTSKMAAISDDVMSELNTRLCIINDNIKTTPKISVIYFEPDELKSGGEYKTYTGNIRRIDEVAGQLIFCDETVIPIYAVYGIESEDVPFEPDFETL